MNTEQSNKNDGEMKGQILVKTREDLHKCNSAEHQLHPSGTTWELWNLTGKQLVTVLNRFQIDTEGVNLGLTLPAAVQRLEQQLRHQLQPGHTSRAELGNRVRDCAPLPGVGLAQASLHLDIRHYKVSILQQIHQENLPHVITLYLTIGPRKAFIRAFTYSCQCFGLFLHSYRERERFPQERTQRSYLRLLFWTVSPAFTIYTGSLGKRISLTSK